jgi:hypothetical protein
MSDGLVVEGDARNARTRQEGLRTRMHTWRTAAIMTCFFTPAGLVFGLAGLIALGNVGSLITAGQEQHAEERLALGRKITLFGTAVAALATLIALLQFIGFALDLGNQFEHLSPPRGGRF